MTTTVSTRLMRTIAETRATIEAAKHAGKTIGFVPTMGALHEGHLSLVKASVATCDRTVVSVFVNPTQFGPGEDFDRYPRELEKDLQLLEKLGCWLVFAPSTEEMYPKGSETLVDVGAVARPLEGTARPKHFAGVATVVLKLFQIVPADQAFFGQKDYQQTLVIQQLIHDLSVPIKLVVCPTVREADGLAMSSRNAYLSPSQREQAMSLWQSLQLAKQLVTEGTVDVAEITRKMQSVFASQPDAVIEYIAFVEDGTVQSVETIAGPTVILLAVRVGKTRLIDNLRIGLEPPMRAD
ncbi:MAG: pantoate--beta-alanine ligase [Planctomycetota bacterium]